MILSEAFFPTISMFFTAFAGTPWPKSCEGKAGGNAGVSAWFHGRVLGKLEHGSFQLSSETISKRVLEGFDQLFLWPCFFLTLDMGK